MTFSRLRSLLAVSTILFSILLFTGCEKKDSGKEPSVETKKQNEGAPKEEAKVTDVKGKYSGTFDKKSAVLNITDQTNNSFKGNLTVNYRNTLKQDVEGDFDSKSMEFTMKDVNPGKFQGTYKGKFSDDFSTLSGTFSLKSKGGSYSFNLKKK